MKPVLFKATAIILWIPTLLACSSGHRYRQAMEMSVEDYQSKVSLVDLSAEHLVIISSKDALVTNLGPEDSDEDDNYVRAFINTRSGRITYQIVNLINYEAEEWKFYERAKYLTQDGVVSDELTVIERSVKECSVFSGCAYVETVGFEIPEKIVKKGAERYLPDKSTGIRYKLTAQSGDEYSGVVFAQELIAVLQAVEDYKKNHLPKVSKSSVLSY
ncbi:MAG: hypothetical protein ACU833_13915 [Gammaproteobacteria bacterium]